MNNDWTRFLILIDCFSFEVNFYKMTALDKMNLKWTKIGPENGPKCAQNWPRIKKSSVHQNCDQNKLNFLTDWQRNISFSGENEVRYIKKLIIIISRRNGETVKHPLDHLLTFLMICCQCQLNQRRRYFERFILWLTQFLTNSFVSKEPLSGLIRTWGVL